MADKSSNNSEIVIMDERTVAAAATPTVGKVNVSKFSQLHIGPKFVSVTNSIHNREVISVKSFPRFLWNLVKSTSRAERLSCAAAIAFLLICGAAIIYFRDTVETMQADVAPHEWNITREMWLAQPYNTTALTKKFDPLHLVIVQHTVSAECQRFINCAAEMRNLQGYFLKTYKYDIPYNFLIGNDGRVYEGRGWGVEGAHTRGYNPCSLGIGFVGDYREDLPAHTSVTYQQLNHTIMLLEEGLRLGYLHPDYYIVGASDLRNTASPGSNLYKALQSLAHFDDGHEYKGKNCTVIDAMFH